MGNLNEMLEETIAAISTPPGEGGIGVIRVSGPRSLQIASAIFRGKSGKALSSLPSHRLYHGHIVDPETGMELDEVLCAPMRSPHSYTGEDLVEIHAHGGVFLLSRILESLLARGARLAQPGEFTKRAFLNGRLDLAQAEAVMDLIQAKTQRSARVALSQLQGKLSLKIRETRETALQWLAQLKAGIDFPEDEVPEIAPPDLERDLGEMIGRLSALLEGAEEGRILREGLRVVITGKPNVGKSSLFNTLLRERRAIVTSIPGTTRDSLEETANIGGFPMLLVDTAGIGESKDPVEEIGVERAREWLQMGDLVLLILDASSPLSKEDHSLLEEVSQMSGEAGRKAVVVLNKIDLPSQITQEDIGRWSSAPVVRTSLLLGKGLQELEETLCLMIHHGSDCSNGELLVSHLRHKEALAKARGSLEEALVTLRKGLPWDFLCIDLEAAVQTLGEITGESYTGTLLNAIFQNFCIGK